MGLAPVRGVLSVDGRIPSEDFRKKGGLTFLYFSVFCREVRDALQLFGHSPETFCLQNVSGGCLDSTGLFLQSKQVDHCAGTSLNCPYILISANFVKSVKETFAKAFSPSFATAWA